VKKFVFSRAAETDLDDNWNYSAEQWGLSQAERYIRMIEDTIVGLTHGTQPGQSASYARSGYRRVLVGSQVLFFKETLELIDVIRILHQRMDPSLHLNQH
jgi:toxin ParE1/3/4